MRTGWSLLLKHTLRLLLPCLAAFVLIAAVEVAPEQPAGHAAVVTLNGVVSPATAEFVQRAIRDAQEDGAALIVIRMDTPGGLDSSMRAIIQEILASKIPVVTYVHPEGARAASAGTFILYASHVAAMTPASNLGAATPVALTGAAPEKEKNQKENGSTQEASSAKAVNDAAAYIRSLAQLRGRNIEFAEQAVRQAVSLSAQEALEKGVIDIVAADMTDLLSKLDGREITLAAGKTVLAAKGMTITHYEPDLRHRFLALIANPQIALILMMLGVYGLFFEFTSPGFGVPGVAGIVCLLLALYALQMMPVNWVGVALLLLGLALMIAEAMTPSFGVFGVGGVIAFVVGGIFLVDRDVPGFGISPALVVGLGLFSAVALFLIGTLAVRSHNRPVVSGGEEMIGKTGTITGRLEDGAYWVNVLGEHWRALSAVPLEKGQSVRVDRMEGLTLYVSPLQVSS